MEQWVLDKLSFLQEFLRRLIAVDDFILPKYRIVPTTDPLQVHIVLFRKRSFVATREMRETIRREIAYWQMEAPRITFKKSVCIIELMLQRTQSAGPEWLERNPMP